MPIANAENFQKILNSFGLTDPQFVEMRTFECEICHFKFKAKKTYENH